MLRPETRQEGNEVQQTTRLLLVEDVFGTKDTKMFCSVSIAIKHKEEPRTTPKLRKRLLQSFKGNLAGLSTALKDCKMRVMNVQSDQMESQAFLKTM